MSDKYDILLDKVNELLHAKRVEEERKEGNVVLWILAIVGAIAAVACIAYFVFRYFEPDYLEEYSDDLDDDFEDDLFEDEDDAITE